MNRSDGVFRAVGPARRRARHTVSALLASGAAVLAAVPCGAADLGYAVRPYMAPLPPPAPPPYAYAVDPRCVIAPMPQADLVGDTARFRATAICQSRGLYTDTLMFPGPPVMYRGYSYGREP